MNQDDYLDSLRMLPALPWIDANRGDSAFASNRFGPTAKAREFIEMLFEQGAVEVFVADPREEEDRILTEGGPYADTLVVVMPEDPVERAALFKVFDREAGAPTGVVSPDEGQTRVLLWWD